MCSDRPQRGTGDMLCAIQVMLEKLNGMTENQQDAYNVFIDYSKAFDNVDHIKPTTTLYRSSKRPRSDGTGLTKNPSKLAKV